MCSSVLFECHHYQLTAIRSCKPDPESTFTYRLSVGRQDSLAPHPIECSEGVLEWDVSFTQQQLLSAILEKPISLQIFSSGNQCIAQFEMSSSFLTTESLSPFSNFSLINTTGTSVEAQLSVEIVPPIVNYSPQPYSSDNWIPVTILDASLPLPHSPLHLQVTEMGYALYRNTLLLFSIPFATIETSMVYDNEVVELIFNREDCPWSHWMKMRLFCEESSPLWNLLACSPPLTNHRSYRFVRKSVLSSITP